MPGVVRVPTTGDGNAYVLLNVQQEGALPLDLRIVGTDGIVPFVLHIKQKSISKLRSKISTSDDDWSAILSAVLVQDAASQGSLAAKDIEIVATVSEASIELVIRKNIRGITQRLGSLTLQQDQDQEIAFFEWTGQAAASADTLRGELSRLHYSVKSQQDAVAKLTAQLDDLVAAKKEHEDVLVQKFAALLNSKKLKIRDQQRLLANAEVNPAAAEQVQASRSGRTAGTSRSGKRKADGSVKDEGDSDGSDDEAFETAGGKAGEDEDMDARTPERSETEDDGGGDSDVNGFEPTRASSQAPRKGNGKAVEAPQSQKSSEASRASQSGASAPTLAPPAPPPRRQLPFATKPAAPAVHDDSTDDDEL